MIPYSFHPLAECDIREAAHFFESRSPGLGKQFRLTVDAAITVLRQFPEVAQVERDNLRCMRVPRFKYNVVYAVEASEIYIYAVVSQWRRPEIWLDRIP